MPKVERASLPFKFLNQLEGEATEELNLLLDRGMRIVEAELRDASPGDEEFALTGSNAESLEKTISESRAVRELRTYQRRIIHNAPLNTNQLSSQEVKEAISSLTWDGGTFRTEGFDIKGGGQRKSFEETIPLCLIKIKDVRADDLKFSLNSKKPHVCLLKKEGHEKYYILEGASDVLAAKITHLPAIEAIVHEYEDLVFAEERKGFSESDVLVTTHPISRRSVYRLHSHLEPIGEMARNYSLADLTVLDADVPSTEEEELLLRAKQQARELKDLWFQLYDEMREAGKSTEEANRAVREDPRWIRNEILSESRFEQAEEVREKWDQARISWRKALVLSDLYAAQDGIEPGRENLVLLYNEARKAIHSTERPPKGAYMQDYRAGDSVEVLSADGIWRRAEVIRTAGDVLRVRREDGQYRAVEDMSTVRREGEGQLILDVSSAEPYNEDMKEIQIKKFNVIIPAGSNSLKIERTLESITEEMNRTPLKVNKDTWERNLRAAEKETIHLTEECHQAAGKSFNPNSSKDCKELFINQMGLPVQKVNKKSGEPALDKETLQVWHNMGEVLAGKVIDEREAQSKLSQLRKWEPYATEGSVQCNWNQLGTPMGRYSCDNPNLQNRIVEIRETIEAHEGYVLISNDLGQAEYVTWASLSGDPTLKASFEQGTDFHTQMFEELKSAAPSLFLHEKDPRKSGKTINFALLYLMQPFVLGKRLGVSMEDATKIIQTYRDRAPLAVSYIDSYLEEVRKTGRTYTHFGRTRFVPEMKRSKGPALHQARKTSWHHHNSGTAAEIVKIKQVKTHKALRREGFDYDKVRLLINLHDELIYEVRKEIVNEVRGIINEKFKEPVPGFIPFGVTEKTGRTWLEISK